MTLPFAMNIEATSHVEQTGGGTPSLAERLGFKSTDKILIINGDDAGNSHAANAATIDAIENGLMTSATIMVPCPWFPEIAAYAKLHPQSDFGLHLTHTSEWKGVKWGPVASKSEVPGLVDPQGYLWPDIMNVYKNATPEQAYLEARAQVQKALAAGIDVTHLDSHMGALQYNDAYFQVYRRLAKEFDLPIRMGSQEVLAAGGGGHQRGQLDSDGVVYTDYLIHGSRKQGEPMADYWKRMLKDLKPGVTELYIHAALAGRRDEARDQLVARSRDRARTVHKGSGGSPDTREPRRQAHRLSPVARVAEEGSRRIEEEVTCSKPIGSNVHEGNEVTRENRIHSTTVRGTSAACCAIQLFPGPGEFRHSGAVLEVGTSDRDARRRETLHDCVHAEGHVAEVSDHAESDSLQRQSLWRRCVQGVARTVAALRRPRATSSSIRTCAALSCRKVNTSICVRTTSKKRPKDIDESTDTYDTIDWLVKNIPNNNGRVGMWGISYPGFYAAVGMIDAHPALKAVSPQAPIADWFIGDDFHHNGTLFLPHAFNFFSGFGRPRPKPTTHLCGSAFNHGTPDGYKFFLELGPLRERGQEVLQGQHQLLERNDGAPELRRLLAGAQHSAASEEHQAGSDDRRRLV